MDEKPVVIVGAGGHGKVVAEAILSQGRVVAGFVDDDPHFHHTQIMGLPVLGAVDLLANNDRYRAILAIGNNRIRREVALRLSGVTWVNAIHARATVSTHAILAAGCMVIAGAVINVDASIGRHTIINTSASVDHDCVIGDYVHIAPGVRLGGGVRVGDGAFIGIGAAVLPYHTIGTGAIVGAGAVVVKDVSADTTVKGVPAR